MNQIRALVWKDLRIHARSIAVYLFGWPIATRVLVQTQHAMGFTQGQSLASMMVPTALSYSAMMAVYVAQWLIQRERGKATFAWIRTLPVSDLHTVLGKFGSVLVSCLIGSVAWRIATLGIDVGATPWQWLSACVIWFVCAGLALLFQVMFSGRLASMVPGTLFFLGAAVALLVSRSPEVSARAGQLWNDPWAHVGLWVACMAVQVSAVGATYHLFHVRDSHTLVE